MILNGVKIKDFIFQWVSWFCRRKYGFKFILYIIFGFCKLFLLQVLGGLSDIYYYVRVNKIIYLKGILQSIEYFYRYVFSEFFQWQEKRRKINERQIKEIYV